MRSGLIPTFLNRPRPFSDCTRKYGPAAIDGFLEHLARGTEVTEHGDAEEPVSGWGPDDKLG